ncbi:CorA family divalent cation transporter [Yoonia sp. I 8.24]|uniref:CorA family divalent cation transporter n=1 Tax=Yoonia sp. I 8.24 TaxID=1537229 RepID=UPI001EE06C29|nr:CorA family divalent cation transporter [Yoonia sp. I 8.24]MCG3267566.1 zinc transporter ZntB [Yoonia sp. I 8.24]
MLPNPLHAYDIGLDGTSAPAGAISTEVDDKIAYRWLHFDLADPHLRAWCDDALPPRAARALLAAKTRPHMDDDEKGIVLTLRGINLNDGQELANMVSLRLWITPRLVISVRRLPVKTVDTLAIQIADGDCPAAPGNLITRIAEDIVERVEKVSVDLEERADAMEDGVYQTGASDVPDLFDLQRTAIRLRRHIGPLKDALGALAINHGGVLTDSLRNRMRDTANRAMRSVEEVEEVRDRLRALSAHIDITQEARIARNGYTLSVVAAIFLPLSFITGLLGVNVGGMPWVDHPDAFLILCALMVGLGAATYAILRWIKWF